MKHFFATLLGLTTLISYGQKSDEPLLSVSPIVGVGLALPPKVNITSGNLSMTYIPSLKFTGSVINSAGQTRIFSAYVTSNIGLETTYHLKFPYSISASVIRNSQLSSYKTPFAFDFAGGTLEASYDVARYYNYTITPRHSWITVRGTKVFAQLGITYSTNFSFPSNKNSVSSTIGNYVENGKGYSVESLDLKKSTFLITPEIGYRQDNDRPIDFSLALQLPFSSMDTEKYTFYQNSKAVGTNLINMNQAVVWIRARYTLDLLYKKVRTPKPPKPPKEKPEPIIVEKKPEQPKEKVDFGDKKIEEGEKIVLKNIQFEQSKSTLNSGSMAELDKLVELMRKHPKMKIEITGHTSNEGVRADNIELSLKRAEACKDYLRRSGIQGNRIETKGFGPDQPISSTDKSLNRRVEFSIIRLN